MPTSHAGGKDVPLQPSLLKPGMDSPMKVQGQFEMSSQSQVSKDNLLVLHFILQSIDGTGSPAHLLSNTCRDLSAPAKLFMKK